LSYIIKNLHFIVIHVPLAMLIFSFVFDICAMIFKKKEWHSAGMLCLIVGTLGAIAAVITGPEDNNPLKATHELFGEITMVLYIVLTIIRVGFLLLKKMEIGKNVVYLIPALVGIVLVSYTGHLGGQMVHKDKPAGIQKNQGNLGVPGSEQKPNLKNSSSNGEQKSPTQTQAGQ
jgi:uncharacterized membrane protein